MDSLSHTELRWRLATAADAPALVDLIRAAYRGPASYERWTSEEQLVRGTRTDERSVLAAIEPARAEMLVVEGGQDGAPVACCRIADRGDGLAYFGMFAVDPARQGGGTGRRLVGWAEQAAAQRFGASEIELEVLAQQALLRAWYERLGYTASGETRPFPADPVYAVPMRDDLSLIVLTKRLPAAGGVGGGSPGPAK
jgi:ribosomal protein S18 acetylase RimI-like enzyme